LGPLRNLTALTTLYIGHTPVSDLGPLRNLTALTELHIFDTSVSDLGRCGT